ncbi:Protein of unknown function [Pyronema omphalodes CBS 100304]|uniref:Uncharacterized protein n=1 Tax=Pyronema omphalodes (strain CBS 100304) TaxID=1076935 RepID=U4LIE2_PYROM|nr:Protein of unknown function [Pyronema omphalodes CBS 100304]
MPEEVTERTVDMIDILVSDIPRQEAIKSITYLVTKPHSQ